MSLSETLDLLSRQQEAGAPEEVVDDWQRAVEALLADIEAWLEPWILRRQIAVAREPVQRSELGLGTYEAQSMRLDCSGTTVVVEPIARMVPIFDGRVDLYQTELPDRGYSLFWRRNPAPNGQWLALPMQEEGGHIPGDQVTLSSFPQLLDLVLSAEED